MSKCQHDNWQREADEDYDQDDYFNASTAYRCEECDCEIDDTRSIINETKTFDKDGNTIITQMVKRTIMCYDMEDDSDVQE